MNNQNLPEITQTPQWVCWQYIERNGKKTKMPIDPNKPQPTPASATNTDTWSSYDQAQSYKTQHGLDGVGFVLSENDPYFCIDVDKDKDHSTLKTLWDDFPSYTEKSPSLTGTHIWGKTTEPPQKGMRKGNIEVYTKERFITFTNLPIRPVPIADCTQSLCDLIDKLKTSHAPTNRNSSTPVLDDNALNNTLDAKEVINKIKASKIKDKFLKLASGDWQDEYPSQSEADMAFVHYLAFFGASDEAITSIWQKSKLWRDKCETNKGYVPSTIKAAKQLVAEQKNIPDIDLDSIFNNTQDTQDTQDTQSDNWMQNIWEEVKGKRRGYMPQHPDKETQDIFDDLEMLMPRRIRGAGVWAMLSWVSGELGNRYNIYGQGLNMYTCIVSDSGSGKEGVSNIVHHIASIQEGNGYQTLWRSAGNYASGQALIKSMVEHNCRLSIMSEFGKMLGRMCGNRAASGMQSLYEVMLQLYSKSGARGVFDDYEAVSKESKRERIYSPSFTVLAESAATSLYPNMSVDDISSGFGARVLFWEGSDERSYLNYEASEHNLKQRTIDVINSVSEISRSAHANNAIGRVVVDDDINKEMVAFDKWVTDMCNKTDNKPIAAIMARIQMSVLKIASLSAVIKSPINPRLDMETVKWAVKIVFYCAQCIISRINAGGFGQFAGGKASDVVLASAVKIIQKTKNDDMRKKAACKVADVWRIVRKLQPFVDKEYPEAVFASVVDTMCKAGMIRRLSNIEMEMLGVRGDCIAISDVSFIT